MTLKSEFIKAETLESFIKDVLRAVGCDDFVKSSLSKGLLEASLRGTDSHGVKLLPHYIRCLKSGRKNPRPIFKFENVSSAAIIVDADRAPGISAMFKAVDIGCTVATSEGICILGVKNSSHPGALAPATMEAAKRGMLCLSFANADSLVLPPQGRRPFFGTNPICFSAPMTGADEPFCIDMATSLFNWNKLMNLREEGKVLPHGVAADVNGDMTVDPNAATQLLPAGGYKGLCLALMVESLTSVLLAQPSARALKKMYEAGTDEPRFLSQTLILISADAFGSQSLFGDRLALLLQQLRSEPSKSSGIECPGDQERMARISRSKGGIPIPHFLIKEFVSLATEYDLDGYFK